jgi:hypothetical protein
MERLLFSNDHNNPKGKEENDDGSHSSGYEELYLLQ